MRAVGVRGARQRRDIAILASFPALPARPAAPETVQQAAVFRLYPNKAQAQAFRSWIGAGRWVWNRFVAHNAERWSDMIHQLTHRATAKAAVSAWRT